MAVLPRLLNTNDAGAASVAWFSADATGATNSSTELQEAIDYAAARGMPLYIPPGTYSVTGVTVSSPVTILGAGDGVSILKQPAHVTTDLLTVAADCNIMFLGLDGNKANQTVGGSTERTSLIRVTSTSADLSVHHCDLSNSTAAGISTSVAVNGSLVVQHCKFREQANGNGVSTSYPDPAAAVYVSSGTGRVVLTHNTVTQATPTVTQYAPGGFQINGTAPGIQSSPNGMTVDISHNFFSGVGNTNPGIGCVDLYNYAGKSVVVGNRCVKSTGCAIKLSNSPCTTVAGNVVVGQEWTFDVAAIFYSGAARALPELPFDELTISGNVVRSWDSGNGIHLVGDGTTDTDQGAGDLHTRGVAVSGNVLRGCKSGIYIDGCADLVISGNVIRQTAGNAYNEAGIVFTRNCGVMRVTGNHILESAGYGIVGVYTAEQEDCTLVVSGNTFRSDAAGGAHQIRAESLAAFHLTSNVFQGTCQTAYLGNGGGAGATTPSAVVTDNVSGEATVGWVATALVQHGNSWDTQECENALAPGSFALGADQWHIQYQRLQLTGTQRLTLAGTARYCITDL